MDQISPGVRGVHEQPVTSEWHIVSEHPGDLIVQHCSCCSSTQRLCGMKCTEKLDTPVITKDYHTHHHLLQAHKNSPEYNHVALRVHLRNFSAHNSISHIMWKLPSSHSSLCSGPAIESFTFITV